MESFLLGDQGPEVFYEVQEDVVRILEEKYYPLFVASDQYQRMLTAMEEAVSSENVESTGKILIFMGLQGQKLVDKKFVF